jgi:hypothetical protein
MPVTFQARSMRGIIAALMMAIVGVLALDACAIVAAPTTSSARAQTSAIKPSLRLLHWAGQEWEVAPPSQSGPDEDAMADSKAAAHVDSHGRLHLAMTKVDGGWRSVELIAMTPAKYGKYRFVTTASIATLARPLDFGMFVIRPGAPELTNEVDLEDSRALIGMRHGLDAQYVVQPYNKPHHIFRYAIKRAVKTTQQSFNWTKSDVKFLTRRGAGAHGAVVKRFHYHGSSSPTPSNMSLRINLFIHGGDSRKIHAGPKSVILDSFTYTPAK